MSKQVYIYGLYDPITKELRYIGKANDLRVRLWCHIRDAKGGQKTYKATWIRKLLKEGHSPLISEIQETTQDSWQDDEKRCIAQALAEGANLTNHTKGGDGILGYNHSEETRQKISKYNKSVGRIPPSQKGRKQSSEHIRKRVEARKRNNSYKHTKQAKKNISEGRKGKAMGNTNTLGYKHTDEWKEEQSKRTSGKNNPFYGKSHSEETKKKISEAKRKIRKYYLSSNKPRDLEIVMTDSIWYDNQFGFYLKDLNLFLDEDGLELMDVKKWWRVDKKPSKKMIEMAEVCRSNIDEVRNMSIEELAKEIGF